MRILAIIAVLVLALVIFICMIMLKAKKEAEKKKAIEEANIAPQDKIHLLTLGNIFLTGEPIKTLKMIDIKSTEKKLSEDWGITSNESAERIIRWLLDEGQRSKYQQNYDELMETLAEGREHELKSSYDTIVEKMKKRIDVTDEDITCCKDLSAFDFERLAVVIRGSYNNSYITEEECYKYLEMVYEKATSVYKNWKEYAVALFIGYTVCLNTVESIFFVSYAADFLQKQDSLWSLYPLGK